MRFVVFGILDMRWKYRKMVKPQERLFMQSKRLHKESFLWNDLFHDKNKSEPIANRRKVRIYSLWEALTKKIPGLKIRVSGWHESAFIFTLQFGCLVLEFQISFSVLMPLFDQTTVFQ